MSKTIATITISRSENGKSLHHSTFKITDGKKPNPKLEYLLHQYFKSHLDARISYKNGFDGRWCDDYFYDEVQDLIYTGKPADVESMIERKLIFV